VPSSSGNAAALYFEGFLGAQDLSVDVDPGVEPFVVDGAVVVALIHAHNVDAELGIEGGCGAADERNEPGLVADVEFDGGRGAVGEKGAWLTVRGVAFTTEGYGGPWDAEDAVDEEAF
jgi:hypothetical protein